MANSTLKVMQEIENAAQEVLDSYDAKVQDLRQENAQELKKLAEEYDAKTASELAEKKESSAAQLVQLKKELSETISKNDLVVRSALTHKKDDLVQGIVYKVVEKYGH